IVRITLEIVHAVRIYLGRDHADDQLVFMRLVNHLCDFQREVAAHLLQYGIHFRIAEYDLAGELLMIRIEDRFKTVGKWAVPEVVKQCSTECEQPVVIVPFIKLLEVHDHTSDDFVYAEGMVES